MQSDKALAAARQRLDGSHGPGVHSIRQTPLPFTAPRLSIDTYSNDPSRSTGGCRKKRDEETALLFSSCLRSRSVRSCLAGRGLDASHLFSRRLGEAALWSHFPLAPNLSCKPGTPSREVARLGFVRYRGPIIRNPRDRYRRREQRCRRGGGEEFGWS